MDILFREKQKGFSDVGLTLSFWCLAVSFFIQFEGTPTIKDSPRTVLSQNETEMGGFLLASLSQSYRKVPSKGTPDVPPVAVAD